jgi:hypothetical protein
VGFQSVPTRWRSADVLPFVQGPVSMPLMIWAFEACPSREKQEEAVTRLSQQQQSAFALQPGSTVPYSPLISSVMPRAARQNSLPQRRPQYGRVRPARPTDAQLNTWGDLAGLYGESMRRMACRICLSDPINRDAIGEKAKADFYADPVRYPCTLPPRDQATAYYERIQRILDKANEITTLYECVRTVCSVP